MPNWNELHNEIKEVGTIYDDKRRQYLKDLQDYTERNVLIYYSGWLQKHELRQRYNTRFSVNDSDMTGFMSSINKLDTDKGLDLLLHTPGGEVAATESIVNYLRSIFGLDIRVFVPQLALSAGTMIACASKEIFMGKQSSLGPIDPQLNGLPAHGIIEEFERAKKEVNQEGRHVIPIWQTIINKYSPTFVGECEKAMQWAKDMVGDWLRSGMFEDDKNKDQIVDEIVETLSDHSEHKTHSRHISMDKAREAGLKITALEDDDKLQDLVLTVHHITTHTLANTGATKIIENHNGTAFIGRVQSRGPN